MAIRINTIEYGWETNQSTISGSVLYTSPTKSISIVETGSRRFIAADLHLFVRDSISRTTIPQRINTASLGIYVDNNYVTSSFYGTTLGYPTTSDHFSLKFISNFTNHFNSFFTSSQHNCQFTFETPTGSLSVVFTNHTSKLILTYEYDDVGLEKGTKTVKLPFDSHAVGSGTAMTAFARPGAIQSTFRNIPTLDTWLPETNKIYKDIFLETHYRDASGVTTPMSMSFQIDSGSIIPRCVVSQSLSTGVEVYDIYSLSGSLDTSSPHSLKASARLGGRVFGTTPILNITYEYDVTSSQIMNSLIIPVTSNINNSRESAVIGLPRYRYLDLFIPEPNPVLKESSVFWYILSNLNCTNTTFITSSLTYSLSSAGATVGGIYSSQRFDSGSINNITPINNIKRGNNTLLFSEQSNANNPTAILNADYQRFAIINYTSDNIGIGKNSRTLYLPYTGSTSNTTGFNSFGNVLLNGDITSSYYISNVIRNVEMTAGMGTNIGYCVLMTDYDDVSGSFYNCIGSQFTGLELQSVRYFFNYNEVFKKYSSQPLNTKLSNNYFKITSSNSDYAHFNPGGNNSYHYYIYDYLTINHNINYISCSLLNCNFPSNTYDIYFYISGSTFNQPINILSLSGSSVNKSGSFDWYDNFQNIYAVCYQPEFGISNLLPAGSGSHTINFQTSTGSSGISETSYTFIG